MAIHAPLWLAADMITPWKGILPGLVTDVVARSRTPRNTPLTAACRSSARLPVILAHWSSDGPLSRNLCELLAYADREL